MKKFFLAVAVAAIAGVNVHLANDIRVQRNELSLLNLENIAEALENWIIEYGTPTYKGHHSASDPAFQGTQGWGNQSGAAEYKVDVYRTIVDCVGQEKSDCTPFIKIVWCNPQRVH